MKAGIGIFFLILIIAAASLSEAREMGIEAGLQKTHHEQRAVVETAVNKPNKMEQIFGTLPYRNLNYPSKEPNAGPSIKPAYKGGNKVVSPDDTKYTDEAPISLEIAELAQSLNWKPVLIYEYVKNNIETEWYWGCMKGAEETLRQKTGNDCDQATLLAALLRASGFPTRYVRGTIEFFAGGKSIVIDKVKNLTGINDPLKIAEFFQKAGIPYKPVIQGGKITNFQIEHIWIESRIPYGNYRGTMIDDSDPTWLGLDTSIKVKGYEYNTPRDILGLVPLAGLGEIYLNAVNTLTPLEYVKGSIEGFLAQQYPTVAYNDLLRKRTLLPQILKILPNSLQFVEKKITNEYTQIPDELKHKVRFAASDTKSPVPNPLFDLTMDTMELSNRQIALSYEPETVEDQEIIDSYGGLDNTPAYLIRLRPFLTVDGDMIVAGKDGLPMGQDHILTIELISPNGTETITNTHITGNMVAIGITSQKTVGAYGDTPFSEEDDAETILSKEAYRYIDRWNQGEEELASLLHLAISRPIPTVVTVGGVIDVTYLLDVPYGFEWKGVYVDANMRAISVQPSAVSVGANGGSPSPEERKKTFMQLSALQGSILENRIFEDDFHVDSISTAKLFQVVGAIHESPASILTIDKTNINNILPTLDLADNIKEDITNTVNQNLIVRMPAADGLPLSTVSYKDWTGIGYTKENLTTAESGYMLSGMLVSSSPDLSGIAGGMTAVSPDKWPQWLLDILGRPYAGEYKTFEITYPRSEALVFTSPLTVKGIVLDTNAKVFVNSKEAEVEGTTFTVQGINLTRGVNKIRATATTASGVTLTDSVTVRYRPLLRTYITFPYDGANLSVSPVDVEGIVSDAAATINVNGTNAVVSPDGRFIARGITLTEGANQITAIATNPEGETDTQTITVNYKANPTASPIQISITSPTDNEIINRPSVLVKGTVTTNADEVWIKVNGVLAEVYNGQFVANHVPLMEGDNRIIVNATDSNGGVGRAETTVKANTTVPCITLNANITSGISPLTSYFTVTTEMPNAVTSYQIDFDGDGVIDYTGDAFENMTFTYTTEGVYYPMVTAIDDQGNTYTDSIAITVLNKVQIDALLKGKWEVMKAALQRGNINEAIGFFSADSRQTFREIFGLLAAKLPALAEGMREITMSYMTGNVAEYYIKRLQLGTDMSYFIYFVRDENGIWRINDF